MSYNVAAIGYIDVSFCKTSIVDKERVAKDREASGEYPFAIWMEHNGPFGDGVEVNIKYNSEYTDDAPLCNFYIPNSAWKTFVQAVKCLDTMWDQRDEGDDK